MHPSLRHDVLYAETLYGERILFVSGFFRRWARFGSSRSWTAGWSASSI